MAVTLKPKIEPYICISCGEHARERYGRIYVDHTFGCVQAAWIRETYPRLARRIDLQRQRDLDVSARKKAA